MIRICLLSAITLCSPCLADSGSDNPVLGEFNWNPVGAHCPEIHVYRPDGTKTGSSGSEVLEKTYTIEAIGGGMYRLQETVVTSNGGKDCTGSTTAPGGTSTVYVMPLNGGGFFTCASPDTLSCYGNATPRTAAGKQ